MDKRLVHGVVACLWLLCAFMPGHGFGQGYAEEDRDWGVPAQSALKRPPYTSPTPREIPGAAVIGTQALQAMLSSAEKPLLIDVLAAEGHASLPGALWIGGAGRGSNFFDPVQAAMSDVLAQLTRGNKDQALVFFCASVQCWLSYNAALRTSALGYGRVYWYRGGIEAWRAAGLPLEPLGSRK